MLILLLTFANQLVQVLIMPVMLQKNAFNFVLINLQKLMLILTNVLRDVLKIITVKTAQGHVDLTVQMYKIFSQTIQLISV